MKRNQGRWVARRRAPPPPLLPARIKNDARSPPPPDLSPPLPLRLPPFFQGLIWTAGLMYRALHALNIPVPVQEVCVLTAPLFSAFCALSTFAFVREIRGRGAGLAAAALVSVVPSYVSRSVAGSFDNEGVAIFALVTVFFFYTRTLNTGSLAWAAGLAGAYAYMVASWGGYTFIINLLPIHALALIVSGRASARLYIAFAPLVIIGTLEAAAFPVVGFNAVLMSEHFGAFFTCIVLHAALLLRFVRGLLPQRQFEAAVKLALTAGAAAGAVLVTLVVGYVVKSPTFGWTGEWLGCVYICVCSCVCVQHVGAEFAARRHPGRHAHTHTQNTQRTHTRRPLADAARPHVRVPLCADHRVRVRAPAAQLAILYNRPARGGAAGAGRHHRVLQEPHQRRAGVLGGGGGKACLAAARRSRRCRRRSTCI